MFPMVSVRPKSLGKTANGSESRNDGVQKVREGFHIALKIEHDGRVRRDTAAITR